MRILSMMILSVMVVSFASFANEGGNTAPATATEQAAADTGDANKDGKAVEAKNKKKPETKPTKK